MRRAFANSLHCVAWGRVAWGCAAWGRVAWGLLVSTCGLPALAETDQRGWHFPPPGEGLEHQQQRQPEEVGLKPELIAALRGRASRWALWRHGYLVHAHGDWNQTQDVKSLRKTWHALAVGAAIQQGRIPGYCQPVAKSLATPPDDNRVTWWHLITQTSALDYPHADHPAVGDPAPGEVWTYSDKNPRVLCTALARVYGKRDYADDYAEVLRTAYFDAIGLTGWSARVNQDGIRLHLDLEDMGRLGLLVLARGRWRDEQLVPPWFVEQLEAKQTRGTQSVYNGPDDGQIEALHARRGEFPQCPYGFMTWVNTDGDFYPRADRGWAWGAGAGGTYVLWNRRLGIVFAGVGVDTRPSERGIPQAIEEGVQGPNPLVPETVGQWQRWEQQVRAARDYRDPYRDVTLDVVLTRPDGSRVNWWGFFDGDGVWRVRYLPDQLGVWRYEAALSDGSIPPLTGSFTCVAADAPGMLCVAESNPTWFGRRGKGPVLLRGLHVGDRYFADNWPQGQRTEFLEWARGQRYNLLSVASHYLNRDAAGRGRGWQTPKLWPLAAAEFRKLEGMLDDLAARRIAVYPFAGFFGQRSNYPREPADQEAYVRYTLARFAAYPQILLNVAGPEPNIRNSWMPASEVERLGRLIRDLDPLRHPLSVHNRTGDDPFRDSDWTSFGTLQGPKTTDRQRLSRGLLESHHAAKPLLAQETLWSGNENHPDYSDADLRKNAYVVVMSGAALVFADMAGNSSTGFSGTLSLADRRQPRHDIVRRVWDFFETVPLGRLRPRQDLTDAGYCLAEPGKLYLVYLDGGGSVSVAAQKGDYAATWINARRTADRREAGRTSDGRNLTAPDPGDWLLLLRRLPGSGDN